MPWEWFPYRLLKDFAMALDLPDPQQEERNLFSHGWISFIGWVAGISVALAYVVRPVLAFWASMFHPEIHIPEIPLSSMWPPVLAILGAGTTRVASNFVKLREARKDKELNLKVCANCPTQNCEACPLKAFASSGAKPPSPRDPSTTGLPDGSVDPKLLGFPDGFAR